jgi:hypothetical protein
MVSNVLGMSSEELLAELQHMAAEYKDDAEYRSLRAQLPADWPI